MSYYSYSQILGHSQFRNPLDENAVRKSVAGKNTIFLSHSHQDADMIVAAINFLLTLGASVYVDWLDSSMPKTTSGETATKIKAKIVECDRFVVLLSENSRDSKWVPWELGFADGVKEIQHIAIFPIRRNQYTYDSAFQGLEYMTLYPVIQEGTLKLTNETVPSVFPPPRLGGSGKLLKSGWLETGKVYF